MSAAFAAASRGRPRVRPGRWRRRDRHGRIVRTGRPPRRAAPGSRAGWTRARAFCAGRTFWETALRSVTF